jgi:hypothetical protein
MTTKYEAMREALEQFIEDAIEIDVGGGDVVYTSCESFLDAKIALAMPDDKTREESSVVVPEGWKMYSADFSMQASGREITGSVTLIRDHDGRKEWHKLSDEDREQVALYAIGYGITVDEATEDAAQAAAIAYPPP